MQDHILSFFFFFLTMKHQCNFRTSKHREKKKRMISIMAFDILYGPVAQCQKVYRRTRPLSGNTKCEFAKSEKTKSPNLGSLSSLHDLRGRATKLESNLPYPIGQLNRAPRPARLGSQAKQFGD